MINKKNLLVVTVLIIVNIAAFLWGKYETLTPLYYIAGFIGISIISLWFGNRLDTKDLAVLAVSATLLSLFDEYAHTSAGTLSYYDQAVPSPLTIFGWSVFMISVIAITTLVANVQTPQINDNKKLRIVPVIASLILVVASAVIQNYIAIFSWVLVLIYLFLFASSFYYTNAHPLKWNVLLMIVSLILGASMEYMGGLEGLWTFRFNDPISLLILFSWPLRVWAVNAVCFALEVDFSKDKEKHKIEFAPEMDSEKSIIVVADTHFGLKKNKQYCDPKAFSDFLDWVVELEKRGGEKLNLGNWGFKKEEIIVKPPEKMVFIGDILELWDTTKESVDACSRSLIQTLSKLNCQKFYVLGNHDHDLAEISGTYPLGMSTVLILEREYATSKGEKKLLFLHGHQFDKLFALPSWRIMPLFNKAATVFGNYTWLFVALFAAGVANTISLGISGWTDYITLISLGAISIPFLTVRFGRDFWNSRKTTKYKPEDAEDGLRDWWKNMGTEDPGEMNIVYGHTHSIGYWSTDIGKDKLTLFNLPSWVRNLPDEKSEIPLEDVFRHGFLYIDKDTIEFAGWDTRKKKPFLVPKSLVQERREGLLTLFESEQVYEDLLNMGWPPELIEKWSKFSFPKESIA